jgi:hypothetical protein
MFYAGTVCSRQRHEHAVVQVSWPEGHLTRVHRLCKRIKSSTDVREEQGTGPFTPMHAGRALWPQDGRGGDA